MNLSFRPCNPFSPLCEGPELQTPSAVVNANVYALEVQLNRFARWLSVVRLPENGVVTGNTWILLKQVVSGFVPELMMMIFGDAPVKTDQQLINNAVSIADVIRAKADALKIDEKAPISKKTIGASPWPWIIGGIVLVGAVGVAIWASKRKK